MSISVETKFAIIGGTGFERMPIFTEHTRKVVSTPYGDSSSPLITGKIFNYPIVFLSRHGEDHKIAPHCINYRANIHALKQIGIERVIALAAVGGISSSATPGQVVIPNQIIDYTWGRKHTFYDGSKPTEYLPTSLEHIDFTQPYDQGLREKLLKAAELSKVSVVPSAVYGVTQGPRLESAAEIDRLERDGANIVGMTGMPEASLAKEIDIDYATIALVVNEAAGRGSEEITMGLIHQNLQKASEKVLSILKALVQLT
jgi:5'-methylthioinosine phosphorylase